MKVVRGYKTQLAPTPEQYVLFCQCAGAARFAYNYGLFRKQEARKASDPVPYASHLQKELTARKHDDLPWLLPLSKWILQNALRDLDTALNVLSRSRDNGKVNVAIPDTRVRVKDGVHSVWIVRSMSLMPLSSCRRLE